MRETKEQKMARLERLVKEKDKELIEMRKERKSRNYKMQSLEKRIEQLEEDNERLQQWYNKEKNNNVVIKESISQLTEQLNDADVLNEQLQTKLRLEESEHKADNDRYEAIISKLKTQINQLEQSSVKQPHEILRHIADIKSDAVINEVTLQLFKSGSIYYDNTIFNISTCDVGPNVSQVSLMEQSRDNKKPFFSADDLIIRVNPRTGMELDEDVVKYIISMLGNESEYELALCELGDYSCFHDGDELDAFAYEKGLELLELYEKEVF